MQLRHFLLVSVLNPEWWFGVAGRKRHEGGEVHRMCGIASNVGRRDEAVGNFEFSETIAGGGERRQ